MSVGNFRLKISSRQKSWLPSCAVRECSREESRHRRRRLCWTQCGEASAHVARRRCHGDRSRESSSVPAAAVSGRDGGVESRRYRSPYSQSSRCSQRARHQGSGATSRSRAALRRHGCGQVSVRLFAVGVRRAARVFRSRRMGSLCAWTEESAASDRDSSARARSIRSGRTRNRPDSSASFSHVRRRRRWSDRCRARRRDR